MIETRLVVVVYDLFPRIILIFDSIIPVIYSTKLRERRWIINDPSEVNNREEEAVSAM
jgi:hypothetical protein